MRIGDMVVCINARELGRYGIKKGKTYQINSLVEVPGDKEYATIYVDDRFLVVASDRFQVIEPVEDVMENPNDTGISVQ